MSRILGLLLILFLIFSCEKELTKTIDVSEIEVDFKVDRFEEQFYTTSETELINLKNEYPFMFPTQVSDTTWIAKINNEDEHYLFAESQTIFGDFKEGKEQLKSLFKHIKYYNPKFEAPNIITHISDLDYQYPVIYADTLLFISLDMYLGKDNIVYKDFPAYLSTNYKKENIVVDVAKDIINQSYPKTRTRVFLDKMINEGKFMYLLDAYVPNATDELKLGCTFEKMEWAQANEINVWKYFIEEEMLYSNDTNLNTRFIDVAPFSKFYQEADQDSPGQIGVWIGWQIVRSYMKNNDVTLSQLMATPAEEIYKKSKYKPRKQ